MAPEPTAAIVRHTHVLPKYTENYLAWRSKLTTLLGKQPGFSRLEVHPPAEHQPDWISIEHFDTVGAAQAWLQSEARTEAIAEIASYIAAPDSVTLIVGDEPLRPREVTAVINNKVSPGKEEAFRKWHQRIQTAQSGYPGYRGVDVQAPIAGISDSWVTLLSFDTAENMRNWLDSPECKKFEAESADFVTDASVRISRTSFKNWLPAEERAANPPSWKVNAIVLLVLYPVVMLTVIFLNPIMAPLGVGPSTFIGNIIGVASTGFLLVPWAARLLSWWLAPPTDRAKAVTIRGTLLVLGLYALCIVVLSWLAGVFLS